MTLSGSRATSCKMPCVTTRTRVTQGPMFRGFNVTIVRFTFPNQVNIKNVTVDKFDFMESLNFLGSNLGLWPAADELLLLSRPIERGTDVQARCDDV